MGPRENRGVHSDIPTVVYRSPSLFGELPYRHGAGAAGLVEGAESHMFQRDRYSCSRRIGVLFSEFALISVGSANTTLSPPLTPILNCHTICQVEQAQEDNAMRPCVSPELPGSEDVAKAASAGVR